MKFTIGRQEFAKAINTVLRAVDGRVTLPVLGNILVRAMGKEVEFVATNLEITVQTKVTVEVEKEGEFTVPAKLIASYVALVVGEKVVCELLENQSLRITAGGSKTEIKGIAAEEFPVIPELASTAEFTMAAPVLAKALEQVIFAASSDPTRPILNSILVRVQGNTMKLAATNSYRLAEKELPVLGKQSAKEFLIPAKSALELASLLAKEAETVQISISENQIGFRVAGIVFVTRLMDGKFPDYQQIIPQESAVKIRVVTEDLINSLKRAGLFADSNSGKVRLKVGKKEIMIISNTGQIGSDEIILPAKIEGEELEIALNVAYLIDMLGRAGALETEISLISATKPAVFHPAKDDKYTYVVMPLKLD